MRYEDWPAVFSLPARIVRPLLMCRNFIWGSDKRIVEEAGLSWTQFSTLVSLRFVPPDHTLSPTELYSAVQATSGGMTKALHALTDAGHVVRVSNPKDRRSQFVKLTPKGKELVETLVDNFNASNGELIETILSPQEAQQLADLLGKLSAGLRKK